MYESTIYHKIFFKRDANTPLWVLYIGNSSPEQMQACKCRIGEIVNDPIAIEVINAGTHLKVTTYSAQDSMAIQMAFEYDELGF